MKCLFNFYYSFSSEVANAPRHVREQQIQSCRHCIQTKLGLSRQGYFWIRGPLTFSVREATDGKSLAKQ